MLPNKTSDLLQLATRFLAGLGCHQSCSDSIAHPIGELQGHVERLTETASILGTARNTADLSTKRLAIADKALKNWLGKARLVVMLARGARWSQSWIPTGFTHSRTNVPSRLQDRIVLARALVSFFARHPEYGVGFAEITAARGRVIYERVSQSCEMLQLAKADFSAAREQHRAADASLRGKLEEIISTLSTRMDDHDPRWTDLGFVPPAARKSRPRKSRRHTVPPPIPFVPESDQLAHRAAAA